MTTNRVRRAGSRWRLLAHEWRPGSREQPGGHGTAHHYEPDPDEVPRPLGDTDEEYRRYAATIRQQRAEAVAKGWATYHALPGTEFDELVVDSWLHVEQMDTGTWWANIGGVTLHVRVDRDGRPKHVTVHGPGDYDYPVEGCGYEIIWSDRTGKEPA